MSTDFSAAGASPSSPAPESQIQPDISSEVQRNTSGSSDQLRKISEAIAKGQQPQSEEGADDALREEEGQGQEEVDLPGDNRLVVEDDVAIAEAAEEGEAETEPEAEPEPAEEPLPTEDAPADRRKRLNPKEIAEQLGVPIKAVYDMGVPFGGELVPLGKLKDAYQDQERTKSERATNEARSIARENELMAKEAQLRQMVNDVSHAIEPETAAKYEKQYKDYIQREQEAVFTAIPDWTDPAVLATDRKAITKVLRGYGYGDGEIASLHDHRLVKLIRDYTVLHNRISALKKIKPKPVVKTSPKPGRTRVPQRSATADAVARAKRSGGRTDTIRAIGALIEKG